MYQEPLPLLRLPEHFVFGHIIEGAHVCYDDGIGPMMLEVEDEYFLRSVAQPLEA